MLTGPDMATSRRNKVLLGLAVVILGLAGIVAYGSVRYVSVVRYTARDGRVTVSTGTVNGLGTVLVINKGTRCTCFRPTGRPGQLHRRLRRRLASAGRARRRRLLVRHASVRTDRRQLAQLGGGAGAGRLVAEASEPPGALDEANDRALGSERGLPPGGLAAARQSRWRRGRLGPADRVRRGLCETRDFSGTACLPQRPSNDQRATT